MLLRQDSLFQVEFHFDLQESIFKTYSQRHKINVHEKIILLKVAIIFYTLETDFFCLVLHTLSLMTPVIISVSQTSSKSSKNIG